MKLILAASVLGAVLLLTYQNCGQYSNRSSLNSTTEICSDPAPPPPLYKDNTLIPDSRNPIVVSVGQTVQFGVGGRDGFQAPCGAVDDQNRFWFFEGQVLRDYCFTHIFNNPGEYEIEWQFAFGTFGCYDPKTPPQPGGLKTKLKISVQ